MKKDVLYWITVLLVALGYSKYLLLPFFPAVVTEIYGSNPSWFPTFSLLVLLVGGFVIKGLLQRKKYSLYLLLASVVIWLLLRLIVFTSMTPVADALYGFSIGFILVTLIGKGKHFL